ncbi:hypothetical protein ACF0H5_020993 [Mactra antiquata]
MESKYFTTFCVGCILFGSNCSTPCPTNCAADLQHSNLEVCSADTNDCLFGCVYGFSGQDCSIECPSNCGMYPAEGPQMTCNESSLVCTNGCNVTYTGPYCNESCSSGCNRCDNPTECTECKNDFFRSNGKCYHCQWQCNPPPQTNITLSTCSENDGRCEFGCENGYYGLRCKDRCSSTCKDDLCERVSGTCTLGCVTNDFTGLTCNKRCNDGCIQLECNQQGACLHGCDTLVWGDLCDEPCNANCNIAPPGATNVCNRSDGTCLHGCKNDIYRDNQCTEACSAYCFNGTCDQRSGNCSNGCNSDTVYGISCETPCNENCLNGKCLRYGGECKLGCEDGWYGEHCDKECGANCFNDVCDRDGGACLHGCDNQWYGSYCTELCNPKCVNRTCYIDTGNCSLGCVFGSAGAKCDIVDISPTHGPPDEIDTVWIYVGIGIGAAIIIVGIMITIILVACRWKITFVRRRRSTMYENFPYGQNDTREVAARKKKKKKDDETRVISRQGRNDVHNGVEQHGIIKINTQNERQGTDQSGHSKQLNRLSASYSMTMHNKSSQYTKGKDPDFQQGTSSDNNDGVVVFNAQRDENAYLNINAVQTKKERSSSQTRDYINASYIKAQDGTVGYIATQDDETRVISRQRRNDVHNGVEQHGIIKINTQNERQGTDQSGHSKPLNRLSASYSITMHNKSSQYTTGKDADFQQGTSSDNNDGVVVFNAQRDENAYLNINAVQTKKDTSSSQTRDYINASYIKAQDGTVGHIATQDFTV